MTDTAMTRLGWRAAALVLALGLVVGLGVVTLFKHDAEWAQVFVPAARDLWAGADFYRVGTRYLYPPFGAAAGLPFAALPDWGVRLAFYLINVASCVVLAVASWRLAGGGRLAVPSRETREDWIVVALAAIVTVPFAWNTLLHQQADLLIDALVAAGMLAVWRSRPILGGVLIGLGAAFKGPPMLFLVYFLWRRDWTAALALVLTAVAASLLPDLVARAPEGLWAGVWLHRWVLPATGVDASLGSWGTALIYNQSLAGTIQRLVNTSLVPHGDGFAVVKAVLVETRPLKAVTYALMAAIALATLVASRLADRRRPTASGAPTPETRAIELAMVPLMMLLFSPMSGLAHFPIVAPAALILARRAVASREAATVATLGVALVAALAVNKDLVGHRLYDTVLWSGAATIAGLALWLGCLLLLARGTVSRAPGR